MTLLTAKSIHKSFDQQKVLKNISIEIESGEIHAIIGRSGSGKSTLIRCLAGLVDVDSGEVLFNGEALEGPKKRLVPGYEEIRLVHQDFQLKHKMSVRENIRYELLSFQEDYQEERIAVLLDLCKIKHLAERDISMVSGGEKQRVAIARAMATEPDILLLDEPFSNLDLNTKFTLLEELKIIANTTHTAIVMITHDARDAMEIADHVIVMRAGEVIRSGTPQEVYRKPENPHVAEIIGIYNTLNIEHLNKLDISTSFQSKNIGLWIEDVVVGEKRFVGKVVNRTFSGPYHKIQIDFVGVKLWALDFSHLIKVDEKVNFSIKSERLFALNS